MYPMPCTYDLALTRFSSHTVRMNEKPPDPRGRALLT